MNTPVTTVGIVLPVHNRRDTTLRALRSLDRIDTSGLHLTIVVVDDGSTDGTSAAVAAAFPEVEIVPGNGSLYYAGGTNAGLRRLLDIGCEYIVMANDDAVFDRGFLRELVLCAGMAPDVVVGAMLLRWDTPHAVFQTAQAWDTWYGGWRIPSRLTVFEVPTRPWEVETLLGNCMLAPARAFREVGLLDERRFPHHWADAEFSARLRRTGWRLVVAPRARVYCQPNTLPTPLGQLAPAPLFAAMFRQPLHPMYLPGQWRMRWYAAPGRWRGLAACVIFTVRIGIRRFGFGRWPDWPDPPIGRAVGEAR